MTFPTSITAGHFTALMVSKNAVPGTLSEANLKGCFDTGTEFTLVNNIRDLPPIGTPPAVAKVPVYGSAQSQSVGIQSDAPDLNITINYVAGDWTKSGVFSTTGSLGDALGDGISKVFQVAIMGAKPTTYLCTTGGLGSVPNILFYFVGKVEAMEIQTARDDAITATVTLSVQSAFEGPYTVT